MRNSNSKFQDKMLGQMPKFTVSVLATMLGFAVTIRIIGIDISTPINNLINAEVNKVKTMAEIELHNAKGGKTNEVELRLNDLEDRVSKIEDAHKKKPL